MFIKFAYEQIQNSHKSGRLESIMQIPIHWLLYENKSKLILLIEQIKVNGA